MIRSSMSLTLVLAVLACSTAGAAAAGVDDAPATPRPWMQSAKQPAEAVRALKAVYHDRDLALFDRLLSSDYRFHTYDEQLRQWDLEGMDKTFELRSARCLFRSDPGDTSCPKDAPAPRHIEIAMKGVRLSDDPEHPDSTQHYVLGLADAFEFDIELPDGTRLQTAPATHVFHLVRGDAAVLGAGQPADAQHWYIRRWIERASERGPDGPGRPWTGTGAPGVLSVRPLANPSDPDLETVCVLPAAGGAELAVYDVQGRHCITHRLRDAGAGEHRVKAGEGARLGPGIYWVRLTQPGRRAAAHMVTVR
jgi:hypothetical protein